MKNRFDIQKDMVYPDLPAKFHDWERSNSFKNEDSSTSIDAFFAIFDHFEWTSTQRVQKSKKSKKSKKLKKLKKFWSGAKSPDVTVLHFSGA